MTDLIARLDAVTDRFEALARKMADPELMSDMAQYAKVSKEYKELERIVEVYRQYKNVLANMESARQLLATEKDEDFRAMAKAELDSLHPQKEALEEELKLLLIPKDPNDDKNAILEIRAAVGGDEAALFAGDLFRMYGRFAERQGWKLEVLDYTEGTAGGYKEIIAMISGNGVYGMMKYESGVHRVQRVPATETQGRVHTSAASVAVLPEMEEVEVEINPNDLRIDTFCSSGPGGQSVNTTYSAVRITHLPTGLVVSCQDEKSQIKNKEKAMKVLRARLYELELEKHQREISEQRRSMVKTGERSEKIRTYNFPQSRVTDHRIGLTLYNLPAIMDGELDEIIDALRIADNTEKLKTGVEG